MTIEDLVINLIIKLECLKQSKMIADYGDIIEFKDNIIKYSIKPITNFIIVTMKGDYRW